jgi:hypothetical protein
MLALSCPPLPSAPVSLAARLTPATAATRWTSLLVSALAARHVRSSCAAPGTVRAVTSRLVSSLTPFPAQPAAASLCWILTGSAVPRVARVTVSSAILACRTRNRLVAALQAVPGTGTDLSVPRPPAARAWLAIRLLAQRWAASTTVSTASARLAASLARPIR